MADEKDLLFLKLGGSLITDKDCPMTARIETIHRIMGEIQAFISQSPPLNLIIGHGSGSFGHSVGKKFNTRKGVRSQADWVGFHEVYQTARKLNQIMYTAALRYDLPVMPFPLCSNANTRNRKITSWNLAPMVDALKRGFIPIVYGDVAFDQELGGTIVSTEEIFDYLSEQFHPRRILIAGIEPGIWADYPQNTQVLPKVEMKHWQPTHINLLGSGSTDVTGGMKAKVESMLEILNKNPSCEIMIFSGEEPGNIRDALFGKAMGTCIQA